MEHIMQEGHLPAATGLAAGDFDETAALQKALDDCFLRSAQIGELRLRDLAVMGVEGPCVRSWGDVAAPEASGLARVGANVAVATEPFRTQAI